MATEAKTIGEAWGEVVAAGSYIVQSRDNQPIRFHAAAALPAADAPAITRNPNEQGYVELSGTLAAGDKLYARTLFPDRSVSAVVISG